MNKKTVTLYSLSLWLTLGSSITHALTPSERLGKSIFFDKNLSVNGNQSCAACHTLEAGWTGPDSAINAAGAVYEGSVKGRFDGKPPSSAYATPSPTLHYVVENGDALFIGGNFWDGRATGEKLGNPAADQAQGPFLNPVEQALSASAEVVSKVCTGSYADLFRQVWGADACNPDRVDRAYDYIARSVADFEASAESNAFTSKYDYYLKGKAGLTPKEKRGLRLFKGKAKCANCHPADPGPNGQPPLFTDFTYDNIGMPRNPDNFLHPDRIQPRGHGLTDGGLGAFLASRSGLSAVCVRQPGQAKVPTLRNVDKRRMRNLLKPMGITAISRP